MMNEQDKMIKWYNDSLDKFGPDDFRAMTWSDKEGKSARERYKKMDEIVDFKNSTIYEVGCGWGSFFDFGFTCKEYYGIDVNEKLLEIAKNKYPDKNFSNIPTFSGDYDVAIASGVAGNRGGPARHPSLLKSFLEHMLANAKKVVINFPSTWATIRTDNIEYFSPEQTLSIALDITEKVTIIHDYRADFILTLEKYDN